MIVTQHGAAWLDTGRALTIIRSCVNYTELQLQVEKKSEIQAFCGHTQGEVAKKQQTQALTQDPRESVFGRFNCFVKQPSRFSG